MHYVNEWGLRTLAAGLTSFVVVLALGPKVISGLMQHKVGQMVREDGPARHLDKAGTPTMGGLLFVGAVLLSVFAWASLSNPYVWAVLISLVLLSLLGGIDDYKKLTLRNSVGVPARWKYFSQSLIALLVLGYLYVTGDRMWLDHLVIPGMKHSLAFGAIGFFVLGYFAMVGTSNAVNLTDGLDGLVTWPIITTALGLLWVSGQSAVPAMHDLSIVCGAIIGGGFGFLWFNAYPAQVFMGDVGSLSLGGALATIAIILRQELLLIILGGIFVLETLSVILQVGYFKATRGKRIFKMAPLHHHFELLGWPENKVVIRFCIVSFVLLCVGLLV